MNDRLRGIATTGSASVAAPLEWVGMQGIDLLLRFADGSTGHAVQAIGDAAVDLPLASVKGIHISRLYLLLAALSEGSISAPARLGEVLRAMVDSHADRGSTRARLVR